MDRDARWERTERAVAALLHDTGVVGDPVAAVRVSYDAGTTDEFVEPVALAGRPRIDPGRDAVIFFNFRPDRARQLSTRLVADGVDLTTMTRYADDLDVPVAFPEQDVPDTLAEVLSRSGARQLHVAETEKYAHVTYFFNGGREEEWAGETRILVPSPRDVPSYDYAPEMSASEVARRFAAEIVHDYRFAVVNFANPDMVGHTGLIPAVVRAVETADRCLGVVVDATHAAGGVCLITADHGNAERMLETDGVSPHTAHTTNPVPIVLTAHGASLRTDGELSDLAPTVLALLGIAVPDAMTGRDLRSA
jgi:2,3-bisphosphoglycerate-independent phosphoglycerate mutase